MASGLRQRRDSTFHSDKAYSQRSAKEILEWIFGDCHLAPREKTILFSLLRQLKEGLELTPKQLSLVDSLYEKQMKGMGLESYTGIKTKYGVRLK